MVPRVWAPDAQVVELVLGENRSLLARDGDGWWASDVDLAAGVDYAFSVDGSPPRPDPRSAWQPHGVHGPSRVFDADAFVWSDDGWPGTDVRGRVLYELHVGTFTPEGTLRAAIDRLDHLVSLGVDVIELMPIAAFDGAHGWGYDGVGLFTVHEPYGGPAALQELVDAAHARGLGVCLDVVHNHLGPAGNYLSTFGPYFTGAHETPWGAAANLDGPGCAEVRRWICDSALRWFRDFHVDALRLDAVHALVDDSERHILAQLSDEVAVLATPLARPLSLVAESDLNDPTTITPTTAGGHGMTAQWSDDVHHAIHAFITGERQGYYADFGTAATLRTALTRAFVHDGTYSTFRGRPWGHQVPRGTDGHQFVVFASDHDQVGNRAQGDRPSARLDAGALAIEAALVLLSPYTPMLFMGEEWGTRTPWQFFADYTDPALAQAVREGRRAEFAGHGQPDASSAAATADQQVPDPQDPATFERSRLDWTETAQPEHARMLAWYRTLIELRRAIPELAAGDLAATAVRFDDDDRPSWVVVERGAARIVCNLAHEPQRVTLRTRSALAVLAAWEPTGPAGSTIDMPARSVAVLA
ncbi:malto-oligosyltrehalose trehalohydrolase (plasmid) [Cellulomonas sp. WB94]|uniref:malto-oligosyltrehalose trehalohydrolase n=1 Tax=Cellulomonas sp. WB94 TaxID=2173174 RepID=UPI000D563B7F|nr:malto-oligosyltrehalose trehalohydrolase [Cellulomonas sp. WB94]PVU81759.1 malto-oligosyltrehalose trehalohydrolase [Cellulomonas sp. WB94]